VEPAAGQSPDDVLAGIYTGPKAALRPVHDALMSHITAFGAFETAPKKGYVSLRRKKQFVMIGPATNTRGRSRTEHEGRRTYAASRSHAAGGMCQYKVKLAAPSEVDAELIGWIRRAYDSAG